MLNRELVKRTVIENVTECYNIEQSSLVNVGRNRRTEGEIRYAAGELVEIFLTQLILF